MPPSALGESGRPVEPDSALHTGPRARDLPPELSIPTVFERAVLGCHLRAARALLDWPMQTLAGFSDLSISTVKRLEDGGDPHPSRSRRKAIVALHRAGIRFLMLNDGSVAVARIPAHGSR
ncbi:hypothetical protein MKK58_25305 [Methylobacterium sp. J-078]|uniref:hypothetical protein n=1 Tax=Methylobacterium sp. J-078 TaxID=2836657 RepID=UPI001FB881B8|nr:hypothetical protein [Methylobacterium sp. J-078]MCJ2047828.1 hypothetical protein [Methylobacterium sp. J-078]